MIKKLRVKFILVSLLSILFVLSITIASINIYNYSKMIRDIDRSMTQIVNRESGDAMMGGMQPPMDNIMREHYILVSYNEDGSVNRSDLNHIFFLSNEEALNLANSIYSGSSDTGKTNNLYYKKIEKNNITYVVLIDAKDRTQSINDFLVSSILISSISYLVIALLIILSSKVVFRVSEESYKKQKTFITNASHELKTPLTIISTDLEIIEMDSGKNEWTLSIKDQVNRLTTMTNQLVILSRLDEGELSKYPFEVFSLSDSANECIESFIPTFKKENINLTYDIKDDININANKYLIDELFYIFMDNARKYTKNNGSANVSIYKDNKNKTIISFSNDINEDDDVDEKLLFERFYRSSSTKKEGSGIGLSIAKEIINLHKGNVKAIKENNILKFIISF